MMDQRHLKTIRKGIAFVMFTGAAFSFLDLYGLISPKGMKALLFFQFGPALVQSLAVGGAALISLVAVLGLTLLSGRIYCSFLCPLGIMMDGVIRLSGKRRMAYSKPHTFLRLFLLGCAAVSLGLGSLVVIQLLDPFSVFGRIITSLVRPLVSGLNTVVSRVLETFGQYWLTPFELPLAAGPILLISLVYLGVTVIMAMGKGRLYCNTICPVGTLLGLLSRLSLFRVAINPQTCVSCGKCERICKAGCVDVKTLTVDVSRCVSCFNCLSQCPENSINLTGIRPETRPGSAVDPTKRHTLMLLALVMAFPRRALAQVAKPLVYVKNTITVKKNHPVTPPGSMGFEHFTSSCTACYLCVSHCPGKVLQPGLAAYGTSGFLMPRMDNHKGFCNFTCTTCGEVCPSGAIRPLPLDEKQQVQIGVVHFIRENCIVITQKTECGACSEHCPTKAVSMVVENGLRVPSINPKICVGCGACEYACPSIPHKSIYVDGNPAHLAAERPVTEDMIPRKPDDDFPF